MLRITVKVEQKLIDFLIDISQIETQIRSNLLQRTTHGFQIALTSIPNQTASLQEYAS